MDKILEKANALKFELENLPLVKEYRRAKEAYENDEEIASLKKLIVRAKNEGRMDEYKELLNKFNNHPIYLNYSKAEEEELKEYLREISEILNKK